MQCNINKGVTWDRMVLLRTSTDWIGTSCRSLSSHPNASNMILHSFQDSYCSQHDLKTLHGSHTPAHHWFRCRHVKSNGNSRLRAISTVRVMQGHIRKINSTHQSHLPEGTIDIVVVATSIVLHTFPHKLVSGTKLVMLAYWRVAGDNEPSESSRKPWGLRGLRGSHPLRGRYVIFVLSYLQVRR